MEKVFSVHVDENTLDQYEGFLSKFNNWKLYKRDIKLNTLLNEGKSIEFTIDMSSHMLGANYIELLPDLDENEESSLDTSLKKACGVINDVKFIIKDNKIVSLDIGIKFLTTQYGKLTMELLNDGISLILKQIIQPKYVKFYLTNPTRSDICDDKLNNILKK